MDVGASMPKYIELENAIKSDKFSIEFWIKPERASLENVLDFGDNCNIKLSNSGSQLRLYTDFGYSNFSSVYLNAGSWNHIVCAIDKTTRYLHAYINNVVELESIGSGAVTPQTNMYMGYEGSAGSNYNLVGSMELLNSLQ